MSLLIYWNEVYLSIWSIKRSCACQRIKMNFMSSIKITFVFNVIRSYSNQHNAEIERKLFLKFQGRVQSTHSFARQKLDETCRFVLLLGSNFSLQSILLKAAYVHWWIKFDRKLAIYLWQRLLHIIVFNINTHNFCVIGWFFLWKITSRGQYAVLSALNWRSIFYKALFISNSNQNNDKNLKDAFSIYVIFYFNGTLSAIHN